MEDKLVQVYVKRITVQNNKNFRIIELGEMQSNRAMQILIGNFEAEYIAAAMDKRIFKRPMPYDVIAEIFSLFRIYLREIIIFAVREKVIYSKLVLVQNGNLQEIVVRISDALALAIQLKTPIFIEKNIIDNFFKFIDNSMEQYQAGKAPIEDMNINELKEEMAAAAKNEDYERAAEIRDEIKKRKTK